MENQNNKAKTFQHKRQGKDTNFHAQMKKVFAVFQKYRAGFYTTNPDLFPSIVEPSNTVKL
ncbi:MAG: hypothetical protein J5I52_05750 [Saprospiraceae bacterium]|nr:MAG: hypothetical protein UZ09_BCD002000063 [Bacteroidetes bacterium OLB9]MCO6463635.1 hypothetical protein [Saprospiraceae bacterium]